MKSWRAGAAIAAAVSFMAHAEKPSSIPSGPETTKPITKPIGSEPSSLPQINPNQIPGQQGPTANLPAGQEIPQIQKPFENVVPDSVRRDSAPRDIGREAIDTLRPDRETLGLDRLNADEARKQSGFDPGRFGRRSGSGDSETEALVGRLRGITGRGNQERANKATRSVGAGGITTDPNQMLAGARSGLAAQDRGEPNDGLGRVTARERNSDGSTSTTYTRSDGSYTIIHRDRNGREVSREGHSRDRDGREVVITTAGNQSVTELSDGQHTVRVEVNYDSRTDTSEVRTYVDGRFAHSGRREGPVVSLNEAYRSWNGVFGRTARNVDPDAPGGAGGSPVDTDGKPDDIVHGSDAAGGVGPGARPDEGASAAVTPRLNVNVDLVGQPNPVEGRGGGGLGYEGRGYVPDDFVRPPRPNDP